MLELGHTADIASFVNGWTFGVLLSTLILALVIFCFTYTWRGLLVGLLVLLGALGFAAYEGQSLYASQQSATIAQTNANRVQAWTGSAYGVEVTTAEARNLSAGTATFNPDHFRGSTTFGRTSGRKHITFSNGGSIEAPVALVWHKTAWQLVAVGDQGDFSAIPRLSR